MRCGGLCGALIGLAAGCAADGDGAPAGHRYRPVIPAREFEASGFRGEVVVLDFWATWCGPCRAAMPAVQRLHDEFRGRPVRVYGVSCWERGNALGVMLERGFTYGLVTGGDELARRYGVGALPTLVVIGVDGSEIYRAQGSPGEERAARLIEDDLTRHGL